MENSNTRLLIDAKNLRKEYSPGEAALENLSLTVAAGEIVGLLGPNGAGKTTAIHIFLGLLSPTSGKARVFEKNPLAHKHEIAKKMNFSSAYAQLPSNLKVFENMVIGRILAPVSYDPVSRVLLSNRT